jgi:hypothetical protein
MKDWKMAVAMWEKQPDTEYTAVRMNCCRVRAKTLEEVISDIRAELAATSARQPTENDRTERRGTETL